MSLDLAISICEKQVERLSRKVEAHTSPESTYHNADIEALLLICETARTSPPTSFEQTLDAVNHARAYSRSLKLLFGDRPEVRLTCRAISYVAKAAENVARAWHSEQITPTVRVFRPSSPPKVKVFPPRYSRHQYTDADLAKLESLRRPSEAEKQEVKKKIAMLKAKTGA